MKPHYLLSFFCSLLLSGKLSATPHNIAADASVTSSASWSSECSAHAVNDGKIRLLDKGEWCSDSKLDARGRVYPFPWVQLDWDRAVSINKVVIYDRASLESHTAAGTLLFSDGSRLTVNTIPNSGAPKEVTFPAKHVEWIRFQATDGEGTHLGLSEIEVYPTPMASTDWVSKVNPFIETAKGRYFFFVTGSLPFGMISAAPLTRNINQGGGGYNYNSTQVLGFPQLHDWMTAGLNLMPVTGEVDLQKGEKGWSSPFTHEGEVAQPGYHRLYLERYKLWVEQTATNRVGFYRLSYSEPTMPKVLLSLGGHLSAVTQINAHATRCSDSEIEGYFDTAGRVWGGVDVARVYFVVRFDKPFLQLNSWCGDKQAGNISQMEGDKQLIEQPGSSFKQSVTTGVEARFAPVEAGEQLLVKTAISYVSIDNARQNMDADCSHWDFEQVHRAATDTWNEWLGKIEVKGGTEAQQVKFYTDLWHVLLGRHMIDDANGQYPNYLKGGERVGKATRIHTLAPQYSVGVLPKDKEGNVLHHMYSSDALWLTQWNLNTLWGIAYPEVLDEFSASFLEYDAQGGLLPRGPSMGSYTYIMTGCPATSLITSAYQRGIAHKWNPDRAYKAMKRNHEAGGMLAFDMDSELAHYKAHGYCPNDAGLTIQWSFEDWALGQMAQSMKHKRDAAYFQKRASGWPASLHPVMKLMLPRKADGTWLHTDPLNGNGYVQANAWQATFGLSHQIDRLARLMGGNDSLCYKLNQAFEDSRAKGFLFGKVSYANQPGCSTAHVFAHAGRPDLTQYWVRQVYNEVYSHITPERGYTGNDEDQGQMAGVSALMALGLFSLDGGSAQKPCYDITAPLFDEVTIHLDNRYYPGKTFRIRSHHNAPDRCYIERLQWNGKAVQEYSLPHSELVQGGTLEIYVSDKPLSIE